MEARECPVCFNEYDHGGGGGERTESWPFECTHGLCAACDRQLYVRHDDRCPCCRSARRSDLPPPAQRGPAPPREDDGAIATIFFAVQDPIQIRPDEFGSMVSSTLSMLRRDASGGESEGVSVSVSGSAGSERLRAPDVRTLVHALLDPTGTSLGQFIEQARRNRQRGGEGAGVGSRAGAL